MWWEKEPVVGSNHSFTATAFVAIAIIALIMFAFCHVGDGGLAATATDVGTTLLP